MFKFRELRFSKLKLFIVCSFVLIVIVLICKNNEQIHLRDEQISYYKQLFEKSDTNSDSKDASVNIGSARETVQRQTVHAEKQTINNEKVEDEKDKIYKGKIPAETIKLTAQQVEAEIERLNKEKVHADNPRLVQLIKDHFIVAPSDLPYDLVHTDKIDTSLGQAPFVDSRLAFKEGGFFVESGAHDGEYLSNTLFLERTRHWSGLLVEPLPGVFKELLQKHRKAYCLNACLSTHSYPSKEYLSNIPVMGRIQRGPGAKTVKVQCFPLYSVLLALNQTTVDFLSLDVEGVEHSVLETIPWDKVNIEMLAVEFDKWPGGREALVKYMATKGYQYAVTLFGPGAADVLFRKRDSKTIKIKGIK